MITDQHIEEGLSRACVQAISAKAGYILSSKNFDYGVDGSFDEVSYFDGRFCQSGYSINFQLKSSINWKSDEKNIIYALEAKTYNDLVNFRENGGTKCILILLALPKDKKNWLLCLENKILIGGGCYWYYPDGSRTKNTTTKTIYIPRRQMLNPDELISLFAKNETGKW